MPLTKVAIRNAKPKGKPYKWSDSLGLFLLVQPTGGKLWRLKYRYEGGLNKPRVADLRIRCLSGNDLAAPARLLLAMLL